jgi:hypothetical protein
MLMSANGSSFLIQFSEMQYLFLTSSRTFNCNPIKHSLPAGGVSRAGNAATVRSLAQGGVLAKVFPSLIRGRAPGQR